MAEPMTSQLAVDALANAVALRRPTDTVVHSDRGSQGGFNWLSQHPSSGGVDGTTTGLGCCGDKKAADAVAWPAAGGAA